MKAAHHAAKGHAKKHTHAHKHVHHHHAKHHPKHHKKAHHAHHKAKVHTVGHHQKGAKGLALVPGDVACCTAEALAASLRHLQPPGLSVSDADMLDLFRRAGGDDEAGAAIPAVLEAAAAGGLAGYRARFEPVPVTWRIFTGRALPLLLGADLPGPHAVYATPQGWWSWGELYCPWCEFPDAVVDEAWAVSWH